MKIARAYVATKAEIEPMMKATGLRREHVKCGEVAGEHISAPKWSMRKGELLGVFDLSAFGDKRQAMAGGVLLVQSFGADVCEVLYPHSSVAPLIAGDGVAMLNKALAIVHGRQRKTKERASDMAKASRDKRREGWMPRDEARAIWGNRTKYPSESQALMNMKPGWPRSTVFNEFGSRKTCEAELIADMKAARPKRAPAKKSRRKAKR